MVHMRVRVGDVIEPAALRRTATWPIVNFSTVQYKVSRGINHHTMRYEPKVYRSEQYNCQMNELMFQAGVKGMSFARSFLVYIYVYILCMVRPSPARRYIHCTQCTIYSGGRKKKLLRSPVPRA